jgi:cytochrome c
MIKASVIVVASAGLISLASFLHLAGSPERNIGQQENTAPVIKIISPANNTTSTPGAQVRFEITVSDKEDGESKYDEINTKEVLLRVKYVSDSSRLFEAREQSIEKDPPGLAAMRSSNCFNCHNFDTRSIGPSFTEIRKRYQPTAANVGLLETRVREGSTGVWGEAIMPTHAELSNEQIHNIIEWIMENASVDDVRYYVGTKGSFQIPGPSEYRAALLTASYMDHGVENGRARKRGSDVVVVRVK